MSEPRRSFVGEVPYKLVEWWHRARHDAGHEAANSAAAAAEDAFPALLARKLAALGLSAAEIEAWSPALLDDLKRNCRACPDRQRCIDDIAVDPLAPGWESYCPNSGTLATL